MKIIEILQKMRQELECAGIESADYEARVLLKWIAGIGREEYFMNPMGEVAEETCEKLLSAVAERASHMPLQYLMHSCDFMGYEFYVDERVLIPRQDTECLVERAVEAIRQMARLKSLEGIKKDTEQAERERISVLDLCTGSGCIGISTKLLCKNAEVTLADLSEDALAVAKKNAENLGAELELVQGDLFEKISGRYDFILSNPPYIPTKVIEGLMPEVREHEPMLALDGTEDGLLFYRRIAKEAPSHLKEGGQLFLEIGMEQGADVSALLVEQGFCKVEVYKDLAGLDRIVYGVRGDDSF